VGCKENSKKSVIAARLCYGAARNDKKGLPTILATYCFGGRPMLRKSENGVKKGNIKRSVIHANNNYN
jgi:hypothetical protein